MIRYAKTTQNLYSLLLQSPYSCFKTPQILTRVLPVRTFAKDGRYSGDQFRKPQSPTNNSTCNKQNRWSRSPSKLQSPEGTNKNEKARIKVDCAEVNAKRPITNKPEIVSEPVACPPPLSQVKDVCEDVKPQVSLRDCNTEKAGNKCEEKQVDSPALRAAESFSSKKGDCGPSSFESTPKATDSPPKKPPEEFGSKKWLLGLLALAAGGALVYYLWNKEDNEKDGKAGRGRKRKRLSRPVAKFPATSDDLPKQVKYLLIGGGTAAFSAFRSIKSQDPKAEVLVLAKEPEYPYMRPPLSKEMWKSDRQARDNMMFQQWNGSVRSLFYEPDGFYMEPKALTSSSKGGVAVARGWEVTAINALKKEVTLDDGSVIAYDKCLLAPGSKPKPFPIIENAEPAVKDKVFYFRDIFDFRDLSLATECEKEVVVIGGGFLGSELSCSLTQQGSKVTQVFREQGLLVKLLPSYLSKWLTQQVRSEGVEVLSDSEVVGVSSNGNRISLTLSSGKRLEADYCIVATGATPNTDLANASKLETHPTLGGYLVNSEMLARSNLYIAGDAACFYDERFGRRREEHHDHAVVSGRLAGENMTGAGKPYLHVSMLWSDLSPDLGWEGVGILDPKLETTGVFSLEKASEKNVEKSSDASADETMKTVTGDSKERQGPREQFSKGVVFYMKDGIIVGILMWNLFNRMQLARQILKQECKYDDLNEVAKLFQIHSD